LGGLASETAWQAELFPSVEAGPNAAWHLGSGALVPVDDGSLLLGLLELPAGRIHVVVAGKRPGARAVLNTDIQNHAPAIAVDPDGASGHAVWATEDLRILYRSFRLDDLRAGRVAEGEAFKVWWICHHPDVASNGREVVVTYTDHMHYIKYGYHDGREWHLDKHLTTLHPRFQETLSHSPWFWTDANGAIHLTFVCLTRAMTYDSKWLGEGFSDPQPVEGLYHPSLFNDEARVRAERLSVDRRGGTMLLSSSFLPERHGVYAQPVEAIALAPGEPLLMLDDDLLDELRNAEARLEPLRTDPAEPVLEPTGRKEDFDGLRVMNGGTVLKDGGRYRMWYVGVGIEAEPVPYYDQMRVGYAESDDGVRWQRVDTGNGCTYHGRPAPNCVRHLGHSSSVFIDLADVPARRYKALDFEGRHQRGDRVSASKELGYLGLPRRGWLSVSPDGLHWEREEIVVDYPGMEPFEFCPESAIYDPQDPDPNRRYKVSGYVGLVGRRRGATLACSPDGRRWTVEARTPLLDSMMAVTPVRPAGPYAQIHDATLVRSGRHLLAFYQYQFPYRETVDLRLAVSRHGKRFRFVFPETPLVGFGNPGTWNSAYLMPSSCVLDGDQVHLYYGAIDDRPYETQYGLPIQRCCAGRATAQRDRWVRVSPRAAGRRAEITTAPLTPPRRGEPVRLEVNAKLAGSSQLRVALVEAEALHRELPGFGLESSAVLSGDSLHHRVRWGAGDRLPADGRCFRIRMTLDGAPEDAIYSIVPQR
jgi:hypothetical protein